MPRLELLALLLSIKALLESNNYEKALELINEVIAEAKTQPTLEVKPPHHAAVFL